MDFYSIGLDFGTLTGRAVLVRNRDGYEVSAAEYPYPHGIITDILPEGNILLPEDYSLQYPQDYMEILPILIRTVVQKADINPEDITGIGVDATATTMLPLDENMRPLCLRNAFVSSPHAYIKLWKHHGAATQAKRFNQLAAEREESFLSLCGGQILAEWFWPKVMETYEKAPDVYRAASCFVELGDWIIFLLTGQQKRSPGLATVHAQWTEQEGYPSNAFLNAVSPGLLPGAADMASWPVQPYAVPAGVLSPEMAAATGLSSRTRVTTANSDSPVALFSLGVIQEGKAAFIAGTSGMMMTYSQKHCFVPGAMGIVRNMYLRDYTLYSFGQSAIGDLFSWFVENFMPCQDWIAAEKEGLSPIAYMNRKIENMKPSGIVTLEWMNGCRFLQDMKLKGTISGLSLKTTAAMVYRSLVEAVAFGLKIMVEAAHGQGVDIEEIIACGGIARKSPEIMQIFADILEMSITVTDSTQENAHGSAILGAVTAGASMGGFDSLQEAVSHMYCKALKHYFPSQQNREEYRKLYISYKLLAESSNTVYSDSGVKSVISDIS